MATQASAITFLSTPGQAYHDGMGFVQFYFGLPRHGGHLTFIPIYHKYKVYTAYEYLEKRFDLKTRSSPPFCSCSREVWVPALPFMPRNHLIGDIRMES
jgi:uncharacterized sodium:solute symporter family permease YidK